jgi:hypothetical protein
MAVPALATVIKFLSSQGARKAVQKYGPKAVEKAKNALQLKKGKKLSPVEARYKRFAQELEKKDKQRKKEREIAFKGTKTEQVKKFIKSKIQKKPPTLRQKFEKIKKKNQPSSIDGPTIAMGSLLAARGAFELATREKKSTQQKRKNNNNNKMKLGGLIDGAAIKGKTRTRMF